MNYRKLLFIILLVGLCSVVADFASAEGEVKRVLFIGNSYTAGIKAPVAALLKRSGVEQVDFIHPGGKTLTWHLENGALDAIRKGGYDIVVLQEQSQTPAYPNLRPAFLKSTVELAKAIRASGARPVLFQTWGRRDGDKVNASVAPTFEKMQSLLTQGYARAGELADAEAAPVGEVWANLRAVNEPLARRMYQRDGSHPGEIGAQVSAMVFTHVLLQQPIDKIPIPDALGLTAAEQAEIREAIRKATGDDE